MVPALSHLARESASVDSAPGVLSQRTIIPLWPSVTGREWHWACLASFLIIILVSSAYLAAWLLTPAGYHYTGLLINPIDGHSYLAKMGQGAAGSWLFRLPYTAEPPRPAFLYTYYLALGHLAPAHSPVALVWIYHLARSIFGVAMLLTLYGTASFFIKEIAERRLALLFVGLASGLGWLVGAGPDLTIPEAVTFASLLVNAHFGATLMLMLLAVVGMTVAPPGKAWTFLLVPVSVCLSMIQPYAMLTVGLAAGSWAGLEWFRDRRLPRLASRRLIVAGLASCPVLLYFLWMVRTNPQIGRWMAQNVTPSPPLWQWLTAYGLLVPLAAAGIWQAARRRHRADWLLLLWAGVQICLMLVPISLQRRLSTGLHLPLCLLAAIGCREVIGRRLTEARRRLLEAALLLVLLPSNLLLLLAGPHAVVTGDAYVLLTDDQWEAMAWMRDTIPPEAVVLADTTLGTIIPAWGGGGRVIYGHPFETLEAEAKRARVERYCSGAMSAEEAAAWMSQSGVQVIVLQTGGCDPPALPLHFRLGWQSDTVSIYVWEGL